MIVAGSVFGVIAAICQALGAVLSRQAFAVEAAIGENIDGITAAYQRVLGGVLVTAIFLIAIKGDWFTNRKQISPGTDFPSRGTGQFRTALPWVLLNGLSGPALGVSCYQWALKTAPTGIVLPIVAITPVVIIPLSLIFERESPSRRSIAGGIIAVLGAVALAMIRGAGK
jgi:drug/metabolite transporter (DMT)-like permease